MIVYKRDYVFHLPLQLFHLFPHVEDDFHAGQIDAELARKSQDDLKPLEILFRIEPGIPSLLEGFSKPKRSYKRSV